TDGSREIARDEFPEAELLALPENRHFARGTNAGFERALQDHDCAYVVALNNDTRVDPEWLAALVKPAEDARVGNVASKMLLMDHPDVINAAGLRITRDGAAVDRGWLQKDEGQLDRDVDVFGASGAAALYKREALDTVGLFDEDFVAYLEDVDLAWRIRLAGWECRFAPEAVVYHKFSASSNANSTWKTYASERNRIWNLVQNYPWRYVALAPPWNGVRNVAALRRRAFPGKYPIALGASLRFQEVIQAHLRGRREAYAGLSKALAKRRLRARYRKATAADVGRWLRRYGIGIKDMPVH
ncbi:MAG: glycosyltransferase family 2 protein, partial [Candidatus Thermoplasmatota archaeon]